MSVANMKFMQHLFVYDGIRHAEGDRSMLLLKLRENQEKLLTESVAIVPPVPCH
jgi:hypothetical protein